MCVKSITLEKKMRKDRGWAKDTGRERGKSLRARTAQEQEGEQGDGGQRPEGGTGRCQGVQGWEQGAEGHGTKGIL